MGVAVPRAPFGGWGPGPLKSSVTVPSLLAISKSSFTNKFIKKINGFI